MTIILIVITSIVSVVAMSNRDLFLKLQFNPYQVYHRKEIYRLVTHGFVHAGWWHLIINMFVLYFFGRIAEYYLFTLEQREIIQFPRLVFLLLYFGSMIFASSLSLIRYKDDHWYNAVGASGAVAGIMFTSVFFEPWNEICLYGVFCLPGFIFAVIYIVYSHYMGKRAQDNIAHDAHLLGAIFGFIFPLFLDLNLFQEFISKLFNGS